MVAGFLLGGAALFVALVQVGAVLVYGLIRLVFLLIALGIEHAREDERRRRHPRPPVPYQVLERPHHPFPNPSPEPPPEQPGTWRLFGPRRRTPRWR